MSMMGEFGNSKGLSLSWNDSCIFSDRGFVYFAYLRKGRGWDCELWHDYDSRIGCQVRCTLVWERRLSRGMVSP